MVKAQNLTRYYGDFKAVDAVSFDISTGEIVGLLGHNGVVKTTILKMLSQAKGVMPGGGGATSASPAPSSRPGDS